MICYNVVDGMESHGPTMCLTLGKNLIWLMVHSIVPPYPIGFIGGTWIFQQRMLASSNVLTGIRLRDDYMC